MVRKVLGWRPEGTLGWLGLASVVLMGPGWAAYCGSFLIADASPRDAGALHTGLAHADPYYVAVLCAVWVWRTALTLVPVLLGICLICRVTLHGVLDLVGLAERCAALPTAWAVRSMVVGAAVMAWLGWANAASLGGAVDYEALRVFALSSVVAGGGGGGNWSSRTSHSVCAVGGARLRLVPLARQPLCPW